MSIFSVPMCLEGAALPGQYFKQIVPSEPGCSSRLFTVLKAIVLLHDSKSCISSWNGKRRINKLLLLKVLANK